MFKLYNFISNPIQFTAGTEVTRTCDLYGINDCQTANGIKYCYCNANRCNGKATITTSNRPSSSVNPNKIDHRRNPILREADDEDYVDNDDDDIEGSGFHHEVELPIDVLPTLKETTTTISSSSRPSTRGQKTTHPILPQSSLSRELNHSSGTISSGTTSTTTKIITSTIGAAANRATDGDNNNILTTANPKSDVSSSADSIKTSLAKNISYTFLLSSMLIFWRH